MYIQKMSLLSELCYEIAGKLTFLHRYSSSPPFLGNVSNPSDNTETDSDNAFFNFTVTVPQNSTGNSFLVTALLTFYNTEEVVSLTESTEERTIVMPIIAARTNVSERYYASYSKLCSSILN